MPYKTEDDSVSMFVYLPLENTPTAVDDLLSKITSRTIEQALRGAAPRKVDVKFPKMNLNGEYELPKVCYSNLLILTDFFLKLRMCCSKFLENVLKLSYFYSQF